MNRYRYFQIISTFAIIFIFMANLFFGAADIPSHDTLNILLGKDATNQSWKYIILQARLPQAITAMLCGGSLAISGLLLQTVFRNPLAGPSIFGIDSGASLGSAIVMLAFGGTISAGTLSLSGSVAILSAAFIGAMVVIGLLMLFSRFVKNNVMLLIVGIMIGYISSSAISLLNFFSTQEGVHSYMVWGLGNFGGVSITQIPLFSTLSLAGIALSFLLIKPLNAILLGAQYAENLGINTTKLRNKLIVITGLLTAVTTSFCGPVSFIGLAVPHIARMLLNTDNHRILIPSTILTGAAISLVCNLLCVLPGDNGIIPLNAVTPIIGAPVIIYVILKGKGSHVD